MIHLDKDAETPLSDQIVMQLASLIRQGGLPSGARLPSIRKLAGTLTVSSATVVSAYDRLIARGLIESRASSGFFVAPRHGDPLASRSDLGPERYDALSMIRRLLDRKEGMLHAGSGFLPEAWLEDTLSTRLLARVARKGKRAFVNPGTAEGYAPLRAQLATKLSMAGIPAHADQILMTFGVSQAFDLIARALISPGDVVVVEEPGYFGLVAQLRAHGARIMPVPRRDYGPDPAAFAEICANFRPKLFFTQTLMHNPTGTATEVACAAQILQIATRHDVLIVEDDIYGDLFPGNHAVHLAQLDKLQRVIFTSSFSKVLSPNVRVGYIAAPQALYESFLEQKLLSVMTTSEFDERLIYELLTDGGYRKHVERVKNRLAQNKHAVVQGLTRAGLAPLQQDYAGVFVWAALPEGIHTETLVRDAAGRGIVLTPGSLFFLDCEHSPWLRFNAASANDARLFDYLGGSIAALSRAALRPVTLPAKAS
jgi:DNA-binding transcriptional MocR family regulator